MAEMKVAIEGTVPITTSESLDVTIDGGSTTVAATLTAATTGTGTTVDFGTAANDITMAIIVTGTVAAGAVALDVSQNGTDWIMFSTAPLATNTNTKLTASGEAWRYARGRVSTDITGGATATCTLMSWG